MYFRNLKLKENKNKTEIIEILRFSMHSCNSLPYQLLSLPFFWAPQTMPFRSAFFWAGSVVRDSSSKRARASECGAIKGVVVAFSSYSCKVRQVLSTSIPLGTLDSRQAPAPAPTLFL